MGFRLISPKRLKKANPYQAEEALRRLKSFLDGDFEGSVRILHGFWKDQQDAISYQELREAVKAGVLDKAVYEAWSRDYSVLVARKLKPLWEDAVRTGSLSQAEMSGLPHGFNMKAPRVMEWVKERGAAFVTAVSEEQKQAIQALLAKKIVESHGVDELARFIRPCIGLTERQAKANLRYYDNMVATLKKDHPRMRTESVEKRAREAAAKYAERQHRQRAMTIAQTESAFAYNWGAHEEILQAQAQGLMGKTIKRWCTSGDDQVCSICQAFEGMELDMDKGFPFHGRRLFAGQDMLPPAHPRCACAVEYIEVEGRVGSSVINQEGSQYVSEEPGNLERNAEEDDSFRRVLNEYEEKLKVTYDNMTKNDPPIALSELKGRHARNIQELIGNAPEHYRKFLEANKDKIFFLKADASGHNRYSSRYRGIFINLKIDEYNDRGAYTATFHEMGHHVDKMLDHVSIHGNFGELLRKDARNFLIAYSRMNGYNIEESLYEISDAMREATARQCHIMADLFSGIYGNKYEWKYRHSDSYWKHKGMLESEAFAHFFGASVSSDADELDAIKKVFPEAYSWFDELFLEVAKYG